MIVQMQELMNACRMFFMKNKKFEKYIINKQMSPAQYMLMFVELRLFCSNWPSVSGDYPANVVGFVTSVELKA